MAVPKKRTYTKKNPNIITFKPKANLPQGVSREETELRNVIQLEFPQKRILSSNRQILDGRELDMYIPDNKLAIEFDGVYFHSTAKKDDKFYHLWKTIECEKRGIRLLHILSDEWELKRPLVLDIVKKALGKYTTLKQEDCCIVVLTPKEEEVFMNNFHLLGHYKDSCLGLGILYKNKVVMGMSFGKIDDDWIITRVATLVGVEVEKGFHHLMNYFLEKYSPKSVYASIDRRFESAFDIKDFGFIEIESSNPNTTYTKDFQHRYQESDFKNFDEETLTSQGWYKVYDCGRRRFQLKNI